MDFKLWSQSNNDAKKELRPDLGLRSWEELSDDDKYKIWKYLERYFFNRKSFKFSEAPEFSGINLKGRIQMSIFALNQFNKAKSYAKNYLETPELDSACLDFYKIFMEENENVVLELISLYSKTVIIERKDGLSYKSDSESKKEFEKRNDTWKWQEFDKYTSDLNEVFIDFGLNLQLTRLGFIPRQDKKIIEQIYEPVIKCLTDQKWGKVSEILSDAFVNYRKNTKEGYSDCITHVVSAVEAFLQISVGVKIGSERLSALVIKAQKQKTIPSDFFTETIFKNLESVFARERQETGNAHPKKEYATEKNARMMLNLAMIFLQHCIQN